MQLVELLYSDLRSCDHRDVANRINQIADTGAMCPEDGMKGDQMHFFHKRFTWECKDGAIPGQTAFMPTVHEPSTGEYAELIQQSWGCPNAEELVGMARHVRLVTEFMAQGLEPRQRLEIFHATLQALIEFTQPIALAFKHSAQIIAAENYMANLDRPLWARLGVVNVRFYNISNGEQDDLIMDTRGLDEVGLPDFQCHFRGLDPNGVAGNLTGLGLYVAENGAVIETGHTVQGLEEGSAWRCQLEDSLLDPKRQIIDINPGNPYAAGNRG
jgi:hypothetical protein